MTRTGRALALSLFLLPSVAAADLPLAPRQTARAGALGRWSVGFFHPLTWAFADDLEVEVHTLAFVASPNFAVRHELLRGQLEPFSVSFTLGVSLPWGVFRLAPPFGTKGFFTPTCAVEEAEPERGDTCEAPGLFLVPNAGVAVSYGTSNVLTVTLDAAGGIRLSGRRPDPIDAWPYLDLLLAPIANGHRARAGARYDHALLDRLRLAAELAVHHVGRGPDPPRDPWVLSLWVGADLGLKDWLRITAGVTYYNSDQRRVVLKTDADGFSRFERARSHDFLPSLDLVWAWR